MNKKLIVTSSITIFFGLLQIILSVISFYKQNLVMYIIPLNAVILVLIILNFILMKKNTK